MVEVAHSREEGSSSTDHEKDEDSWSKTLLANVSFQSVAVFLILLDILLNDDHGRDKALGDSLHDPLDRALVPVKLPLLGTPTSFTSPHHQPNLGSLDLVIEDVGKVSIEKCCTHLRPNEQGQSKALS